MNVHGSMINSRELPQRIVRLKITMANFHVLQWFNLRHSIEKYFGTNHRSTTDRNFSLSGLECGKPTFGDGTREPILKTGTQSGARKGPLILNPGLNKNQNTCRKGTLIAMIVSFCLLSFPDIALSQNFGGVPPGGDWLIKKYDHIDVIYEKEVAPKADSVAFFIDQINHFDPFSLGSSRTKLPIILRNKSLTTNGFVAYVPYRSELFLFSAQNPNVIGIQDWLEFLTIHEYRHVLQYSNLNRGITKLTGRVFGHAAQAGIYNVLVPDWFSEGDAVFYESNVTGNGRGQLPSFLATFRALLLEDKIYNYHKFQNGSYKDLVPNHYVHGYLLTSYGYQEYGEKFWPNVLDQTARLKGLFLPFRQAIRRESGHKLPEFHHQVMDHYQANLRAQLDTTIQTPSLFLGEDPSIKDELQIVTDAAGRKYLLQSSYDEIPTVFQLSGNKKKKLFALGRTYDPYIILRDQRIIFTNSGYGSRWTNQEYSDVYYYDLTTSTVNRVTKNQKYLSVDYHPGTGRYLAVEAGEDGQTAIIVFDENQPIKDTLLQDPRAYYAYPRWLDEAGDQFIFTLRKDSKMTLGRYSFSTHEVEPLIGPVKETIARPFPTSEGVYFSSSKTGIDNIYFYDFNSGQEIPVSTDLHGAYNPSIALSSPENSSPELFYSAATANGHRIRKQNLQNEPYRRDALIPPGLEPVYQSYTPVPFNSGSQNSEPTPLSADRYKPGRHLLNFHSLLLEPSLTDPKLSWLSNDYLNTARANIYLLYRDPDQSWETGAELTYAGWYPELLFGVNHRFNRHLNLHLDQQIIRLPKSETSANIGASIPLNFSRRQTSHFLRLYGQYGWTKEHFDQNDPVLPGPIRLDPRTFQTLTFSTDWSINRLRAFRDIIPKWGMSTTLRAKRSFSPGDSWLLYGSQNFYLPGFFRNDGFKLRWQGQLNSGSAPDFLSFELKSIQDLPIDFSAFQRGAVLTANYLFPLAYPEISIPHVIYTKRLAVNLFAERFLSTEINRSFGGVDVFLTARYFNLIELTGGLRISRAWGTTSSPYSWSFVFLEDL